MTEVHLVSIQFAEDRVPQKIARANAGEFSAEAQHDGLLDSQPLHSLHFLFEGLKQWRSCLGVQDGPWMWIEGYDRRG
jgi:hypothetical protein